MTSYASKNTCLINIYNVQKVFKEATVSTSLTSLGGGLSKLERP